MDVFNNHGFLLFFFKLFKKIPTEYFITTLGQYLLCVPWHLIFNKFGRLCVVRKLMKSEAC